MTKGKPISISAAFADLKCLTGRNPSTSESEAKDSFATISDYRDGAIYVMHYAGYSEWERHSKGDEIVYLLEGSTNLVLLAETGEVSHELKKGELIVVPRNTWHRFESPDGIKVLTVTPQPTDHSIERPDHA